MGVFSEARLLLPWGVRGQGACRPECLPTWCTWSRNPSLSRKTLDLRKLLGSIALPLYTPANGLHPPSRGSPAASRVTPSACRTAAASKPLLTCQEKLPCGQEGHLEFVGAFLERLARGLSGSVIVIHAPPLPRLGCSEDSLLTPGVCRPQR